MTSHHLHHRAHRVGRTLGLGLAIGITLIANLGDRAFSASPANGGIDPLQILDTAVKNNVLFFVDTSGSMAGTPENQNFVVGGDDPASRFYQMKRAVREVVALNAGKANFGLATFDPNPAEAQLNASDGLIYVSQDPSASGWDSYFNQLSSNFANINADSCVGATCTTTESAAIFRGIGGNGVYPATCTPQPAGNQVATSGTANPPITHVFGTNCRYYMNSTLMRNGKRYKVKAGISNSTTRRNTGIVSSTNITCPPPPPGLLGDDALAFADGTRNRACYQLQDSVSNVITTYWATAGHFEYVNATPGQDSCNSNGTVISVSDCSVDNSAQIQANMRLELQYNANGDPQFLPPLTSLSGARPGITDVPAFKNVGIRQALFTPLAAAMQFSLNYFRTTVLPAAGTAQRPIAAQGKQRQFVILLTDGDETCGGNPQQAAYNLWSNTLPALPACNGACLAAKGITAQEYAVANRIELLMITFAGGTPATVNSISQAGSGQNPANGVCQPLYPGFAGSPLSPCRNSFIANNLTDLVNALNAAINTSTATGTFSDQQSVTETVYEYVAAANPPQDPLDAETRYAVNVPILLQSTFELPLYKGHLNAFRRSDNGTPADPTDDTTVALWDAGQKLYDRVSNPTTGMGPAPASPCSSTGPGCYTFDQLYGDATPTTVRTSTAKIKRRIFTTTRNGVNPNYNPQNLLNASNLLDWTRVPLWPPTTGTVDNLYVAPTVTGTGATPVRGILDDAMGLGAMTTVAQVQAAVPGACQGTVAANIHPDCTSATAGLPLARAKREAREIILAYIAGARLQTINGTPVRTGTTGPAAGRQQLLFEVRPWIMVESTLAAPGVVTPPLLAGPKSGELGFSEYKLYRDGIRSTAGFPQQGVPSGLGLRNPDRIDPTTDPNYASDKTALLTDLNLKPSMSVVYHATNQGLHAFRAGPCPVAASSPGIGSTLLPCAGETGGEELWAFIPFDQLGKLPALTQAQTRSNKQYLLASPVRFSDVFVPGGASVPGASFTGVWRTLLFFGRGRGGNSYTALDVTVPGQFVRNSLDTQPPIVVWSRGNPDTNNGKTVVAGGTMNTNAGDYAAYLKMGESWSLPAIGYVTAADYTTPRTGVNGTNFAMFVGSGYSDVVTEGKTFYVLDALTGDVIRNFDIPNGSPAPPPIAVPPAPQDPPLTNFLVAPPVVYAEDANGNSPSGYRFIGNPVTAKAKTVYFGDLHGRIWRYDATTPATPPSAFFTNNNIANGNQPFATAVSVLQDRPDPSIPGDILIYAESGHDRRVTPQAGKPFKAYAFKDVGGTRQDIFTRDFETNYRGTVQPASAFAQQDPAVPPAPVVFFAGVKFTGACVSVFDSILIALKGVTTTPGIPVPAFDLRATGDDAFIELAGQKINAIRVSGEGNLVVDTGLNAQNTPPPPGVPVPTETTSTSSSLVTIGLVPGTQAYKDLAATTVPFRVGSAVCRVQ